MVHAKVLAALQKELQNKYAISSTIRHKGERGRSREHGVASFLRENLPAAYGVATGELFSFHSETISSQCDVIVYDDQRTPIFGRGAVVQQVPIEGAYVVIEVRSIIDTATLRDTARKFKAIRNLWKESCDTGSGNKLEDGPNLMLFGFKRTASEKACLKFVGEAQEEDCSVVCLDSGCSVLVGPEDRSVPAKPYWLETTVPEGDMYATLAFFYFGVLNCCRPERAPLNYMEILKST